MYAFLEIINVFFFFLKAAERSYSGVGWVCERIRGRERERRGRGGEKFKSEGVWRV